MFFILYLHSGDMENVQDRRLPSQAEPSGPRAGSASPRSSAAHASTPGERIGPISRVGHAECPSRQLELDITELLALSQSCLSARLSRAHLTSLR